MLKWLKMLVTSPTPAQPAAMPPVDGPVYWLPGGRTVQVHGESHYQDALLALCGRKTREGVSVPCVAALIPEPGNPWDGNAVQVMIGGRRVGYLSKAEAATYSRHLQAVTAAGETPICQARIKGGWKRGGGDEGRFGVELALARASVAFPKAPARRGR